MRITLFFIGVTLALLGVALICWKVSLILAGLLIAFIAIKMTPFPTPDLNNN